MPERYIAFDVETPNFSNNRMSAIGVSVIENNRIIKEFFSLINPEAHFDAFNVQLTGISPEMVMDAPTFPAFWAVLEPVFSSGILIAHNAPFDMSVLAKCLAAYGIHWKDTARYACTCQIGRRCCPTLTNHRLNTMCEHFGISLAHHQADSDSRACAQLMLRYLESGMDMQKFYRHYSLSQMKTISKKEAAAWSKL